MSEMQKSKPRIIYLGEKNQKKHQDHRKRCKKLYLWEIIPADRRVDDLPALRRHSPTATIALGQMVIAALARLFPVTETLAIDAYLGPLAGTPFPTLLRHAARSLR